MPLGTRKVAASTLFCVTLTAEACGAHSNVSCGPPLPEASARAPLGVAKAQPIYHPHSAKFVLGALSVLSLSSPPAESATSPDELQSAAWGGGELRDPKGRRCSANSSAQSTARRTSTAQSSPQFSAPCRPHCGSATAPPHSRRPLGFHLDFAVAK